MSVSKARKKELNRQWREANAERKREYEREYRQANRPIENERRSRWRAANPEESSDREARRGTRNRRDYRLTAFHGMTSAHWAEMWERQGGACYLCEQPLTDKSTVIEHDHRCCRPGASCPYCRRGLACERCNRVLGAVHDNPELLRLIAENLETALAAVTERLAAKPQQLELC